MREFHGGDYDVAVIGAGHAGIEAALAAGPDGHEDRLPDGEPGRGGEYALQPGHRRHRQGSPGPGAGRTGRRDGPGGGQGLHPVSDAEPGQGPRRVVPAGSGGPAEIPAGDEAHAGIAARG